MSISARRIAAFTGIGVLLVAVPAAVGVWYLQTRGPGPAPSVANRARAALPPRLPLIGPHVIRTETYSGHLGAVLKLVWLPDGKRFISAGHEGAIKLWKVEEPESLRHFAGHKGAVRTLAVDAAGKQLASGGVDGVVRVWDVEGGELVLSFPGGGGPINGLAMTDDGSRLASVGQDGKVRIHAVATGQLERTLDQTPRGLSVALSTPHGLVAASNDSGRISLWDIATGAERGRLEHGAPVNALVFTPDGAGLISAGDDRRIVVWRLSPAEERHVIEVHRDEVWTLALSPSGKRLASGSREGLLVLSDPFEGRPLEANRSGFAGFATLAFSPDGKSLLSGGSSQKVWLFRHTPSAWFPKPILVTPPPQKFEAPEGMSAFDAVLEEAAFEYLSEPGVSRRPRTRALVAKARAEQPDHPGVLELEARLRMTDAYRSGDEYDPKGLTEARGIAERAVAQGPRHAAAHRAVAWVALAQKKIPDAVAAAASARALDPEVPPQRRLELAIASDEKADDERILAAAKGVLDADPHDTAGFSALVDLYKRRGEWDAVEAVYKSLMVLQPGSPWPVGNYASYLVGRRRPKEAIEFAKRALAIADYGIGHVVLGSALVEQAHQELRRGASPDEAEDLLRRGEKEGASPDLVHFVRGVLLWADGDFTKATQQFRKAFELNKHNREAEDALKWKPPR